MKKATLASLIVLCGSTAALAQVSTQRMDPGTQNRTTANTMVDQPVADPAMNQMNGMMPDNTISNTPTPM